MMLFAPTICKKSKLIVLKKAERSAEKYNKKQVFENLYKHANKKEQGMKNLKEKMIKMQCPFKP